MKTNRTTPADGALLDVLRRDCKVTAVTLAAMERLVDLGSPSVAYTSDHQRFCWIRGYDQYHVELVFPPLRFDWSGNGRPVSGYVGGASTGLPLDADAIVAWVRVQMKTPVDRCLELIDRCAALSPDDLLTHRMIDGARGVLLPLPVAQELAARIRELEGRHRCDACGADDVPCTAHSGLLRCSPCCEEWERVGPHDAREKPFKCLYCGKEHYAMVWDSIRVGYACPDCRRNAEMTATSVSFRPDTPVCLHEHSAKLPEMPYTVALKCALAKGHTGEHFDGDDVRWSNDAGRPPRCAARPVPVRIADTATCTLRLGHAGNHFDEKTGQIWA